MKARLIFTVGLFFLSGFLTFLEAGNALRKGIIYNMQGPNASAWDIQGTLPKTIFQENVRKDLVNTTHISDPLPFFRRQLKSENGTTFTKATGISLETASFESVGKYIQNHKSSTKVSNIKEGDIYLLRLANSSNYAVLKIKKIHDDGTSLLYDGNNLDYIAFEYTVLEHTPPPAVSFIKNNQDNIETEEVDVLVYPDPVADFLNIRFGNLDDDASAWTVVLENTKGEVVYLSDNIHVTEWKNDFSKLPKGHYILSIYKSKAMYLQKIIQKTDSEYSMK